MKKFLIFFALTIFCLPVSGQILTGEIKYTDSQAQNIILDNLPVQIPQALIKEKFYDNDYKDNIANLLKGFTNLKDRTLGYFSDGSYAINYKDDPLHVWYYDSSGILTHSEAKSAETFPYRTYKYDIKNNLINISLRVSEEETFIYNNEKKQIAHWIGKNCYDTSGNIIMTRRILK